MQILPASSIDTSLGFFGSSASSDGFADAMNEALDNVSSGEAHSVSTALREDDENRALVESPYSRSTSDGVTYTLSEVCFTRNELAELREQLMREGASAESLDQFNILCDQPDGATLAQVIASLYGKKGQVSLSEDDEQAIVELLKKIDPTGDLASDAIFMMANGQGQQALELISAKFAAHDDNIEISLDEMMALGRGLGLNQDSLRQIAEGFRGFSSILAGSGQFDALMEPANNQFLTDAANASKLDAALEKTLKPLIARARERMEKEKEAVSAESRRIQYARLQIDNTVQENSRNTMDATLKGGHAESDSPVDLQTSKVAGMIGAAGENSSVEKASNSGQERMNARNSQNAQNADGKSAHSDFVRGAQDARDAKGQFTGQDFGGQEKDRNPAWNDLFGKIETKPAAAPQPTTANSLVYSMLQAEAATQPAADAQQPMPQMQQMTRQMTAQVEQGMLTALRNGATRMDLQLHPAELGNVAITLIARNGEVSAQIRSEKGETAEMLTRQLDAIRITLEQQGIKVDKLEVAMQNQDENSGNMNWQDLSDHNARQEEHARREEFTRMRNLASLRNNRDNTEGKVLEQSLHNMGETARYAGRAMHVVA